MAHIGGAIPLIALDAVVFDPAHPTREIVLRDGDGSTERILQPL